MIQFDGGLLRLHEADEAQSCRRLADNIWLLAHDNKYKLLCPRGTQTCALAVANIKVNGNGKVILDTHPESDQHQN